MDLTSVDKVPKPRFPPLEEKPKSSTADAMQLGSRSFRRSDQRFTMSKHMQHISAYAIHSIPNLVSFNIHDVHVYIYIYIFVFFPWFTCSALDIALESPSISQGLPAKIRTSRCKLKRRVGRPWGGLLPR